MKISTVREFRDNASGLLRSKDPILVTRRGRGMVHDCRAASEARVLRGGRVISLAAHSARSACISECEANSHGTRPLRMRLPRTDTW